MDKEAKPLRDTVKGSIDLGSESDSEDLGPNEYDMTDALIDNSRKPEKPGRLHGKERSLIEYAESSLLLLQSISGSKASLQEGCDSASRAQIRMMDSLDAVGARAICHFWGFSFPDIDSIEKAFGLGDDSQRRDVANKFLGLFPKTPDGRPILESNFKAILDKFPGLYIGSVSADQKAALLTLGRLSVAWNRAKSETPYRRVKRRCVRLQPASTEPAGFGALQCTYEDDEFDPDYSEGQDSDGSFATDSSSESSVGGSALSDEDL